VGSSDLAEQAKQTVWRFLLYPSKTWAYFLANKMATSSTDKLYALMHHENLIDLDVLNQAT
jgi:hypothetical protein